MPSPEFVDAVLDVVRRIPAGRVMTYGDVGLAIGSNAPRAVGRVMALYGHAVPWWRVVPASGLPPQGHARLALPHYLDEGTPLRYPRSHGHSRTHDEAAPNPTTMSPNDPDYGLALSSARLPYTHEIYAEVAL